MGALTEKMQVVIGKHGRKGVGVERLKAIAVGKRKVNAISTRLDRLARGRSCSGRWQHHLKHPGGMNLDRGVRGLRFLPDHAGLYRSRPEKTDHQAWRSLTRDPMWSQDAERVGMLASYQVFQSRKRGCGGRHRNIQIEFLLIHGVRR